MTVSLALFSPWQSFFICQSSACRVRASKRSTPAASGLSPRVLPTAAIAQTARWCREPARRLRGGSRGGRSPGGMASARTRCPHRLRPRRQSASADVCARPAGGSPPSGDCFGTLRMSLVVLRPGLHSLLVDNGRPHSRSLGRAGRRCGRPGALALGNALAGNPPDALGLEICLVGPILRAYSIGWLASSWVQAF